MMTFAGKTKNADNESVKRNGAKRNSGDLQAGSTSKSAPLFGFPIQRKASCACGGGCPKCQKKNADLSVTKPDDEYEREADAVADNVMRMPTHSVVNEKTQSKPIAFFHLQRKCAFCDEEEKIQRKESSNSGSEMTAPPIVSDVISGNGKLLDKETRRFMESRIGYDFSQVQIHTDSKAAESAQAINALAYTSGNHIVFDSGQYQPHTESGKHLLAHELAHTVQQTDNTHRKSVVQRFYTFAPSSRPKGTLIHSTVLPMITEANDQPDFFTEVKIPGASKKDIDKEKTGIADIYKGKNTIGIKFKDIPEFLVADGKLMGGGGNYEHNKQSAPQGAKSSPTVRRLGEAAEEIEIGDLKPGGTGEAILGKGQISDYIQGIKNTSGSLNQYLKNHPHQNTDSSKKDWNPDPKPLGGLKIPDKLDLTTGKGISRADLSLYQDQTDKPVVKDTRLKGAMFVYKDKSEGIWSYEWIPETLQIDYSNKKVEHALNRLDKEVIHNVVQGKRKNNEPHEDKPVETAKGKSKVIQRQEKVKDKEWKNEEWNKQHYTPWKEESEPLLKDDKGVTDKGKLAEALTQIGDRTQSKVAVPKEAEEYADNLDKIKHWLKFGKLYGWLREKFSLIYTKFQAFAKKVKEKAKALRSKINSSFGSWFKAAVKVIFKIIKMVGAWALGKIVDEVLGSLQRGIQTNIEKVVNMFTPEGVKSKIEQFEAYKLKYDTLLAEKEEELITRFFGKKLKLLEDLSELEKALSSIGTIVDLVKWGVRIVACVSPPLLGCLWNLAIAALEYAFSKLIQTCWFSKKVYEPIMSNISAVKNFPVEAASHIVEYANKHIPVPEGFDPLFSPINISNNDFSVDCSGGGGDGDGDGEQISPQQAEIANLIEEIGVDKFEAFLALARKRGVKDEVELNTDRLKELKGLLESVSKEMLVKAAGSPVSDETVNLEAFVSNLKKAKSSEELAKPKENIQVKDYEKAAKKNKEYQILIGWKPETFGITQDNKVDSKEFADSIYVMQQALGVNTDGIAGTNTVLAYYEKNKLPKDNIYVKAKEEYEKAKIINLINQSYPSKEQLIKDIESLDWDSISSSEFALIVKNENRLIYGKTTNGSRIGAYYKVVDFNYEGKKYKKIIDTSDFVNLDVVKDGDSLGVSSIRVNMETKKKTGILGTMFIGSYPKHSMLDVGDVFLALLIEEPSPK